MCRKKDVHVMFDFCVPFITGTYTCNYVPHYMHLKQSLYWQWWWLAVMCIKLAVQLNKLFLLYLAETAKTNS